LIPSEEAFEAFIAVEQLAEALKVATPVTKPSGETTRQKDRPDLS
jgi:hypothetical protein